MLRTIGAIGQKNMKDQAPVVMGGRRIGPVIRATRAPAAGSMG